MIAAHTFIGGHSLSLASGVAQYAFELSGRLASHADALGAGLAQGLLSPDVYSGDQHSLLVSKYVLFCSCQLNPPCNPAI